MTVFVGMVLAKYNVYAIICEQVFVILRCSAQAIELATDHACREGGSNSVSLAVSLLSDCTYGEGGDPGVSRAAWCRLNRAYREGGLRIAARALHIGN